MKLHRNKCLHSESLFLLIPMYRWQLPESMQWILVGFIIAISLLFLFPPDLLLAKQFSGYAVHWMVFCLALGIVALFTGNEKFLYTGFLASGLIAFFLMNSFNTDLRLARFNDANSITLAFANLTLAADEAGRSMQSVYDKDADVVIIEELTPDQVSLLQRMKARYPYQYMLPRIDPLGKAVLSKLSFQSDSIYEMVGNSVLRLLVVNESRDSFNIVVTNCLPPLTMSSYQNLNYFLDTLASQIRNEIPNALVTANFNLVPWSRELRNFRMKAELNSSRRDNAEGSPNVKALGILSAPNNEIFYSRSLECSMFHIINDSKSNQLGLFGRYQKRRIINK